MHINLTAIILSLWILEKASYAVLSSLLHCALAQQLWGHLVNFI